MGKSRAREERRERPGGGGLKGAGKKKSAPRRGKARRGRGGKGTSGFQICSSGRSLGLCWTRFLRTFSFSFSFFGVFFSPLPRVGHGVKEGTGEKKGRVGAVQVSQSSWSWARGVERGLHIGSSLSCTQYLQRIDFAFTHPGFGERSFFALRAGLGRGLRGAGPFLHRGFVVLEGYLILGGRVISMLGVLFLFISSLLTVLVLFLSRSLAPVFFFRFAHIRQAAPIEEMFSNTQSTRDRVVSARSFIFCKSCLRRVGMGMARRERKARDVGVKSGWQSGAYISSPWWIGRLATLRPSSHTPRVYPLAHCHRCRYHEDYARESIHSIQRE